MKLLPGKTCTSSTTPTARPGVACSFLQFVDSHAIIAIAIYSPYTMAYYSLTHAANYGEVYRIAFLEHSHCSYIIVKQVSVKQKIT